MVTVSIPLRSHKYPGLSVLVDEEDYSLVSPYRWHAIKGTSTFYAATNLPKSEGGGGKRMHRLIMGVADGIEVDHENRYGLDNRRKNLRVCTHTQNQWNRKVTTNTTGYIGVIQTASGAWHSHISIDGRLVTLGTFTNVTDAARAYDAKARAIRGEFAVLNFPDENLPSPDGARRLPAKNFTGYRGITFRSDSKVRPWIAQMHLGGKRLNLGRYATAEDAARAYDVKARELHGAGAWLNFPDERG